MEKQIGKILYTLVEKIDFKDLVVALESELEQICEEAQAFLYIYNHDKKVYKLVWGDVEIPHDMGMFQKVTRVIYDQKGKMPALYGPLKDPDTGLIGIVQVTREKEFNKREIELFKKVLQRVAPLFRNSVAFKALRETLESMVVALSSAIDIRDFVTSGHSKRVAKYSEKLGEKLDLPQAQMTKLNYAALLHDVGKIGIPERVLTKPGRLTKGEYKIIKTHSEKGYDLLNKVKFPENFKDIPNIVLSHHEKLDGSGYPEGIKGDKISLEARIIGICDIFDALTNARHYRKEWTFGKAFSILDSERGQIDGELLDLLKTIPHTELEEIHRSFRI